MNPVLDTALLPPQDREEALRASVWNSFVAVDIEHGIPGRDIRAQVRLGDVGPLRIFSARSTPATIRRTERLSRGDEEPAVFLGLQMTGTSLVVQNGRECVLRPGEFAVYESTAPYTLVFGEGVDHHFLRFPRAALAVPERMMRDTTAIPLGADNPVARLAFGYFSQLAVSEDLHQAANANAVAEPSIELLRAVIAFGHGDSGSTAASAETALCSRITRYVREHLADVDLSAARIASAHSISVRYLYALLSRSGIRLGDRIRALRLAECRRELAGPDGRLRSVAAIGQGWGFVDATHFSKVFKKAYGISPRAWRDQHHPRRLP